MRRINSPEVLATLPSYARKVHNIRFVGWTAFGPVYLTRTVYADGRQSWGVSQPGSACGYGSGVDGALRAKQHVRSIVFIPTPEGATIYPDGSRWVGGKIVKGSHDGRGNWLPEKLT